MIPPTWLAAGAGMLALAAGLGVQTVRLAREQAAHETTKREWSQADQKALAQAVADREAAQGRADTAARAFEAWKRAQTARVTTVRQEVRDAQAADVVCRDRPLPDGLRDALKRAPGAVGARDAGELGSVPAVGPG